MASGSIAKDGLSKNKSNVYRNASYRKYERYIREAVLHEEKLCEV